MTHRRPLVHAALLLAVPLALPAQDRAAPLPAAERWAAAESRLEKPVDDAIRQLVANRNEDGSFGRGSVLDTAIVLTSMGHSHRYYGISDGPVVQKPVRFLIRNRKADGSFGTPLETAYVAEALSILGGEPAGETTFAQELGKARTWLARQEGAEARPFDSQVARLVQAQRARPGSPVVEKVVEKASAIEDPVERLVLLVQAEVAVRRLRGRSETSPAGRPATFTRTQQEGFDFLRTRQEDGVFFVETPQGRFPELGFTSLGLAALQTKPKALRTPAESEVIEKGLAYVLAQQNDDGSFGERNVNYTSCAAVLALARADDPRLEPNLVKAREFILMLQNTEDRGYAASDRDYGSIGYGGDQRGDLSNLQFAIQALRESGLEADHEAFAKAIVFMQRTQNLKSVNDFSGRVRNSDTGEWQTVTAGDDGGAAYYPGNSPAGYVELPDGTQVPRSYGSMTYAMLKAYILCGLERDDPRIQGLVGWIGGHWTLEENPGAAPDLPEKARYQGLYYYYMVLAQGLDTAGIDTVEAPAPEHAPGNRATTAIDWRAELRDHLASLQAPDGSWLNERNGRWYESQKTLCTIYAMLALDRCGAGG